MMFMYGIALYAFTKDREGGINLDSICALPVAQQIVARTFSEYEKNAFNALPEKEEQEAFFNC